MAQKLDELLKESGPKALHLLTTGLDGSGAAEALELGSRLYSPTEDVLYNRLLYSAHAHHDNWEVASALSQTLKEGLTPQAVSGAHLRDFYAYYHFVTTALPDGSTLFESLSLWKLNHPSQVARDTLDSMLALTTPGKVSIAFAHPLIVFLSAWSVGRKVMDIDSRILFPLDGFEFIQDETGQIRIKNTLRFGKEIYREHHPELELPKAS